MPSISPARARAGAVKAETTFVQPIDATKEAVATPKPGERRRASALRGYSRRGAGGAAAASSAAAAAAGWAEERRGGEGCQY